MHQQSSSTIHLYVFPGRLSPFMKNISNIFLILLIYCCNSYSKKLYYIWQILKKLIVQLMQESFATHFIRCPICNSSGSITHGSVKRKEMFANHNLNILSHNIPLSPYLLHMHMLSFIVLSKKILIFFYNAYRRHPGLLKLYIKCHQVFLGFGFCMCLLQNVLNQNAYLKYGFSGWQNQVSLSPLDLSLSFWTVSPKFCKW